MLPAQSHEAGDEQRGAGKQSDRKRSLRADENFAEALLMRAAARSAAAVFQSTNQVRARALPCRINSHRETGQDRQCNRETEHGKRKFERGRRIEWKKIRRHFWHSRNELPCQQSASQTGEHAHEQTFENEKPDNASARGADRHS